MRSSGFFLTPFTNSCTTFLSYKSAKNNCNGCGIVEASGGYGLSKKITDSLIPSIFLEAGLQDGKRVSDPVFGQLTSELIYKPNAKVSALFEISRKYFSGNNYDDHSALSARYLLSTHNDVRIHYDKTDIETFGLSIGHYW